MLCGLHTILPLKTERLQIPKHIHSPRGFRSELVGRDGPHALQDCSVLPNRFRLSNCKECSRQLLVCGPEAGKRNPLPFPAPASGGHLC